MRRPLLLAAIFACALAAAPAADAGTSRAERTRAAINEVRTQHGLAPVRRAARANRRARAYARTVLRTDTWAHAANPARGSGLSYVGEMLGMSSGAPVSAKAMVAMWLVSPEHRAILLGRRYRYAGIGVRRGEFEGNSATVWVVRLGIR